MSRRGAQSRLEQRLRFHLLLQQARRLLLQTNIQRSVAHQMAMPAGTSKRLKQYAPRSVWFSLGLRLPRTLSPQTSQRLRGCL